MPNEYRWGENLWHSTAVEMMTPTELRRFFNGAVVLTFDEMMQHGREMYNLRSRLELLGAEVSSFVCICRESLAETGNLLEYKANYCEMLNDEEFKARATLMSRLMTLVPPPLDVDHLVVRGSLRKESSLSQLLEGLANWGVAFVVRQPDPGSKEKFFAVTLDRPQFFDTEDACEGLGLEFSWDGPCKIRLYVDPETFQCYCSFVVYPRIRGDIKTWLAASKGHTGNGPLSSNSEPLPEQETDPSTVFRSYERICMHVAVQLLGRFVQSGAAADVGINLQNDRGLIRGDHLSATFGPSEGKRIEKQVRMILSQSAGTPPLFGPVAKCPPPALILSSGGGTSHDVFGCRQSLLNLIPRKGPTRSDAGRGPSLIVYPHLLQKLHAYSESTVGRVLDYELDWGTVKPGLSIMELEMKNANMLEVSRAFCRGEFDLWSEWGEEAVHGHKDEVIQRTLGIAPTIVERFLARMGWSSIRATHLCKLFANLHHDWRGRYGQLYYALEPYKYGPIPVVLEAAGLGRCQQFERFLVDVGCLSESRVKYRTSTVRTFRPATQNKVPWRKVYERSTDGSTKAHVGGLARLYAAIQKKCATERLAGPRSSRTSEFSDPLVVLGAARNKRTAYICGWFEVEDWRRRGQLLFKQLRAIATSEKHHTNAMLREALGTFAEPAALLFEKVEMYRNLPILRKKIEKLRDSGEYEATHILLETVDESPVINGESPYPIANLDWAQGVMRAFSSFARQVLTACGLDEDRRRKADKVDEKGVAKDASYYLGELLRKCPEMKVHKAELSGCVAALGEGVLTSKIAKRLDAVFEFILALFDAGGRIPAPPSHVRDECGMEQRMDLPIRLREIPLSSPYAVAVADVKNIIGIVDLFSGELDSFDVTESLLQMIEKNAQRVASDDVRFCGISGDCVVFAGSKPDDVLQAVITLTEKTTSHIGKRVKELAEFGLLRSGVAWFEESRGKYFAGIFPGITAFRIGDKSERDIGDISVTEAVYTRLSTKNRRRFTKIDESTEQGDVFIRHWHE